MGYVIAILTVLLIAMLIYIVRVWWQIRNINHSLEIRAKEDRKQYITLSVHNRGLVALTANLNRCLEAEEKSMMKVRQSENEFKQLIANLSHDLRTPLTAIRGYLQLMNTENLSDDKRKNLDVAFRYSDELGQLIEHFFEYTYLADATKEMNIQTVNLTNLVIQLLADSVALFEENGIEIEVMEGDMVYASIDCEMTTRIVQNLIRNTIAHSAGKLTVKIEQDDMARIYFTNPMRRGYQIDASRIFDRFYTGDQSRHRTTGLGLSIVSLLATQMGGNAKAMSEDGQLTIIISFLLHRRDVK